MKFTCTQDNLQRALRIVGHLTGKSVNLPILSNVLLRVEGNGVELITTNLEVAIRATTRGKVEEAGMFTVSSALFSSTNDLLPKTNIEVILKGDILLVKADDQESKIRGVEASEYPIIPTVEGDPIAIIPLSDFWAAIDGVSFAITPNEVRPEISGAIFHFVENELVIAGTDSYRLAEARVAITPTAATERRVIVPLRTLQELSRMVSIIGTDQGDVKIYLGEGQIRFDLGAEVVCVSRLIEGNFPAYEQIIPTKYKTQIAVSRDELLRAVKRASLFCAPGMHDVTLRIVPGGESKGQLEVRAQNVQLGEAYAVVMGAVTGEENRVVFNARYLTDGLAHIATPEILLEVISDSSPGILRPAGATPRRHLYLIMPIKTA